jgi:hypothetical protein
VAKNNGNAINGVFTYVTANYDFSDWAHDENMDPNAMDWICE